MSRGATHRARELTAQVVGHLDQLLRHAEGLDLSRLDLTQFQKVALVSVARAHDLLDSVKILGEAGYVEEAGVVLRSLFELDISIGYIAAADTEMRAERFLDYDDVLAYKGLSRLRELADRGVSGPLEALREAGPRISQIERAHEMFRRKYLRRKGKRGCSHWSGLNVYELCQKLDRVAEYVAVYQRYSEATHSAARSLSRQLAQIAHEGASGIQLRWGGAESGLLDILCYACGYGIHVARVYAGEFKAPAAVAAPFEALEEEHAATFRPVLRGHEVKS
jgi:hypothetical protein